MLSKLASKQKSRLEDGQTQGDPDFYLGKDLTADIYCSHNEPSK